MEEVSSPGKLKPCHALIEIEADKVHGVAITVLLGVVVALARPLDSILAALCVTHLLLQTARSPGMEEHSRAATYRCFIDRCMKS